MERKGSGLEKILDSYKFQINYTDEKTPRFRSDRAQFTVIMPNLNYGLGLQTGDQVRDKVRDQVRDQVRNQDNIDNTIISIIKNNSQITQRAIVEITGYSLKTVKYHISKLQTSGLIIREGTSQKGKWIIKENK